MATYTFSEFHLDEAELLIDLEGARHDLYAARDYVRRIIDSYNNLRGEDFLNIEALCVTAIIKYGRAFVGGVRKIDKKSITSGLPPEIEEAHNNFLAWRNLHIAHSVNDYEMGRIQARYCEERIETEGIVSVSVAQSSVVTPSQLEFVSLLKTIEYFIEIFSNLIKKEQERVLKIIRDMPIDKVLAMDEPAMCPGRDSRGITVSRKRK
jgi:hypothetical protein